MRSGSCSARCRCCGPAPRQPARPRCAAWPAPSPGFVVGAAPAARHRHQPGGAVDRLPAGRPGRRLHAGNGAVRRRSGRLHRHDRGAVQPAGRRPAGQVGLLRVEDVAIGCAVSLVVGLPVLAARRLRGRRRQSRRRLPQRRELPRRRGQLGAWRACRTGPSARSPPIAAGTRLDDAVRGYLTEQGSKRLSQGRPVGAGDGGDAAAPHRALDGEPADQGRSRMLTTPGCTRP